MDELWVPIRDFPRYEVSNCGRVRNVKTMRVLKPSKNNQGYNRHILYNDNGQSQRFTHRLVAFHFIANPNNLPQVDHINEDKQDNNVDNLRWCTQQQNLFNVGARRNNTSGFKGVSWKTNAKKWKTHIKIDNKKHHLGYFDNVEDAALAYDLAAQREFGEFARLNLL